MRAHAAAAGPRRGRLAARMRVVAWPGLILPLTSLMIVGVSTLALEY